MSTSPPLFTLLFPSFRTSRRLTPLDHEVGHEELQLVHCQVQIIALQRPPGCPTRGRTTRGHDGALFGFGQTRLFGACKKGAICLVDLKRFFFLSNATVMTAARPQINSEPSVPNP